MSNVAPLCTYCVLDGCARGTQIPVLEEMGLYTYLLPSPDPEDGSNVMNAKDINTYNIYVVYLPNLCFLYIPNLNFYLSVLSIARTDAVGHAYLSSPCHS